MHLIETNFAVLLPQYKYLSRRTGAERPLRPWPECFPFYFDQPLGIFFFFYSFSYKEYPVFCKCHITICKFSDVLSLKICSSFDLSLYADLVANKNHWR